jgi:hypothetical protein
MEGWMSEIEDAIARIGREAREAADTALLQYLFARLKDLDPAHKPEAVRRALGVHIAGVHLTGRPDARDRIFRDLAMMRVDEIMLLSARDRSD